MGKTLPHFWTVDESTERLQVNRILETMKMWEQSGRVCDQKRQDGFPHQSCFERGIYDFNTLHALCQIVQMRLG